MEQAQDFVQPFEGVDPGRAFELCPAEDIDGYKVHTRLLHQADVFLPDGAVPLFGVVVAAVDELSVSG